MSGKVYDPNFEFNAPKFHDFTNPTEDDNADAWFDGKKEQEESGEAGKSSEQEVIAQSGEATPASAADKEQFFDAEAGDAVEQQHTESFESALEAEEPVADPEAVLENAAVEPESEECVNQENQGTEVTTTVEAVVVTVEAVVVTVEEVVVTTMVEEVVVTTMVEEVVETVDEGGAVVEQEVADASNADVTTTDMARSATEIANETGSEHSSGAGEEQVESLPVVAAPESARSEGAKAGRKSVSLNNDNAAPNSRKSVANSRKSTCTRTDSRLTESIMALAGYKQHEDEIKHVAQSSVADAAEDSRVMSMAQSILETTLTMSTTVPHDDMPIASRTRLSLEAQGSAPIVPKLNLASALATSTPQPRNHSRTPNVAMAQSRLMQNTASSAKKSLSGRSSTWSQEHTSSTSFRDNKRGHVSNSQTPDKPKPKKARESSNFHSAATPTFSRFATNQHMEKARSASAPRSRPEVCKTPSSTSRFSLATPDSSSSLRRRRSVSDLSKPTASSSTRVASARPSSRNSMDGRLGSATKSASKHRPLTVPLSPKFATDARVKRRAEPEVFAEISRESSRSSLTSSMTPSRLTNPKSPNFSKRVSRTKGSVTDTETLQLKQAEEAFSQLKKRRKVGEARLKEVLAPRGEMSMAARSVKELTMPVGPNLRTSVRTHKTASAQSSFESCNSSASGESGDGYQTLSDRLKNFDSMPDRFKSRPTSAKTSSTFQPKLTNPKSPEFKSFSKKRSNFKSAKEIEDEQVEEMKAKQFKARPLDHRILESCGDLGVPKVEKKRLTTPEAFHFHADDRASLRSAESSRESIGESRFEFKARPVPQSTKEGARYAPAPRHETRKLTIPESPNLHSKLRSRTNNASNEDSQPEFKAQPMPDLSKFFLLKHDHNKVTTNSQISLQAHPMPDFSKAFVPKHDHNKITAPAPFKLSTEERGKQYECEQRMRAEEERKLDEEQRKYKANPIRRDFDTKKHVTPYEPPPLTQTKPFNLQSEIRHEMFKSTFEHNMERQKQEEEQKFSSFHARPVPKTIADREKVFTPQRSAKPLTEVQNIELNVERRTRVREGYEQKKAEREAMIESQRREHENRVRADEERERREMRKNMVVKARPVPAGVYQANFEVQRSTKALTEPSSPQFRMDMRLRSNSVSRDM